MFKRIIDLQSRTFPEFVSHSLGPLHAPDTHGMSRQSWDGGRPERPDKPLDALHPSQTPPSLGSQDSPLGLLLPAAQRLHMTLSQDGNYMLGDCLAL